MLLFIYFMVYGNKISLSISVSLYTSLSLSLCLLAILFAVSSCFCLVTRNAFRFYNCHLVFHESFAAIRAQSEAYVNTYIYICENFNYKAGLTTTTTITTANYLHICKSISMWLQINDNLSWVKSCLSSEMATKKNNTSAWEITYMENVVCCCCCCGNFWCRLL